MPWIVVHPEGPTDYAGALSTPGGLLPSDSAQPHFSDEPSFVSVLEYARAHPRISRHLPPSYPDLLDAALKVLLGDVLDRYIHVSGLFEFDRQALLPIYLEVEKYLLTATLDVAIFVPILCLRFEGDLDIDDRTGIVAMSDRLHLARAPNEFDQHASDPRVRSAATHALRLLFYTVPNDTEMEMWHVLANAESYPLAPIDDFFAALRIVTGHPTGYAQLLALPVGWAQGYKADLLPLERTTVRNYPAWFETGHWIKAMPLVTRKEMEDTADLFRQIRSLNNKRLAVALRRLNMSSLRTNDEDGLLDTMIGLEALLSDGNQEMTYKIALRMAALYRLRDAIGSSAAFREVKAAYKLRSSVVHGGDFDIVETIRRGESSVRTVDAAAEHLRAALRLLISHHEYLDVARIDRDLLLGDTPEAP
jgi:hypothetical protein